MSASSYEHLCHLLTLAYPEPYRDRHGTEIVGVLLDADDRHPGMRRRIRELGSLLLHASTVRARSVSFTGTTAGPRPWHLAGMLVAIVLAAIATQAWTATVMRLADPDQSGGWLDPRWPVHVAWLAGGVLIWARRPTGAWVAMLVAAALATAYPVLVATGIPWPGQVPGTWGQIPPPYPLPGWPLTARDAAWCGLSLMAVAMTATPGRLAKAVDALPRFAVVRAVLFNVGLAVVTGLLALVDALLNHSYWFTAELVRISPLPALVLLGVLAAQLRLRGGTTGVGLTVIILVLAAASMAPAVIQLTAGVAAIVGAVTLGFAACRSPLAGRA